MEPDSEDSFLTDFSSIFTSSQATGAAQSDDGASELTDYCLSGDDAPDKQRQRASYEADDDLYRSPPSTVISSESEDEGGDADADEVDCDESDEGMNDDYPQYLPQRQSSFDTDLFKYNSIHHLKLQPAGVEFLSSTEEGRAALQEYRLEGERVRGRTRGVPQRYKSPDVIQLLVDNPQGSLYPIVAKDNELLLKIDMTILFPRRSDHREFTAAEIHRSGMNDVIYDFFYENRLALNIRQVNILPLHFDAEYFTVLLTLDSSHINRNERPLAILESIVIEYRSTNKGHKKIPRPVQHRRRQQTCQALLKQTLPTELTTVLERALGRFTRLDLVHKYGALFNGAYSKRALEVETCASRIARCMAEMYTRYDKLRKECKEDEEEEAFGPDAYPSGQYQGILQNSSDDVEEIKRRTLEIQIEIIEHDRREIPKTDFMPILITSCYTGKKKRGSRKGAAQRRHGDVPSSSQQSNTLHGGDSSLPSLLSPASSFASSSTGQRRTRDRSGSVRFEELTFHGAETIELSQRSSQRIRERNQPRTNGKYAEEEDSESNAFTESDSDDVLEVDKDDFENRPGDTVVRITSEESHKTTQKAKDVVDDDLAIILQHYKGARLGGNTLPMLFELVEILLEGHRDCSEDSIWGLLSGIMEERQRGGCLDEECYTAMGPILGAVQLKRTKAALADGRMQEVDQLQMVVQKEEVGSEADFQMPVKCFRKTRREADSDDHQQGPAKKRRTGESSQSRDAEKKGGSKGKEKEKEEQVNGGMVGEGEDCGSEMVADNENRLGTMMQMNTMDYSQEAKQQEAPVKDSSPVDNQPSFQPSGNHIVDTESTSKRNLSQDKEPNQTIVQDQVQLQGLKLTSSSQIEIVEEDRESFLVYDFDQDEGSKKRNVRQLAKNDFCVTASKIAISAKATYSKHIRLKDTQLKNTRSEDSQSSGYRQGDSIHDPIVLDGDGS